MKLFKDKEQRKATLQSLAIHLLLTLLFLFFGLTYLDPKPEDGIAIAFGYDTDGGGETVEQVVREQPTAPTPSQSEPQTQDVASEYTQDVEDAPAVATEKAPEEKKPVEEAEKEIPAEETPQEEKKPTIDDRLRNITSNPNQSKPGSGSGKTEGDGVQGREDGSGDDGGADGGGGIGETGNYRLGNRRALNKITPQYDCDGEGRVVVRIRVNKQGSVISAEPGVNLPDVRTTTTSSCLLNRARQAALETNWQSDKKAPDLQLGYIIYNFRKN